MSNGAMAIVGAGAIVLGLLLWAVRGPWDPSASVTSWLGNRAMVMVRTVIAGILAVFGVVVLIWGLVSMI